MSGYWESGKFWLLDLESSCPIDNARVLRVSSRKSSSKRARPISSSVRYQVCRLRTAVAEFETFLWTLLKESISYAAADCWSSQRPGLKTKTRIPGRQTPQKGTYSSHFSSSASAC